jgi:hypothetical protein
MLTSQFSLHAKQQTAESVPGEGVMGPSWTFFVAGTCSMLSQWKVNSASTYVQIVAWLSLSRILHRVLVGLSYAWSKQPRCP